MNIEEVFIDGRIVISVDEEEYVEFNSRLSGSGGKYINKEYEIFTVILSKEFKVGNEYKISVRFDHYPMVGEVLYYFPQFIENYWEVNINYNRGKLLKDILG